MPQRRNRCLPLKRNRAECSILVLARDKLTTKSWNVQNRWVNFKIKDVYVPDPAQICLELHGDDLLQGEIIDVSDSGFQKNVFAVVKVEGLAQPLVVPMDRITGGVCE